MISVGVDTGGTFTDFVFLDPQGNITIDKRPSFPVDPAKPALEGLSPVLVEKTVRVIHGTTVATNALLEGKTATTALITTAGFEDILEIARQNRPELYALNPQKPPPLIEKSLRIGVNERILADGSVERGLETIEVEGILKRLKGLKVEAVAICLLHSYANPSHERVIGNMAREMGFIVSVSSELLPEFREYERTCVTVVNACLQPIMKGYLERLASGLGPSKLSVMQSSGGVIPASLAGDLPVHTALSGPAGGVIAAGKVAKRAGFNKIITFDMGGTSTDVSLYDGAPQLTAEKTIAGLPIRVPALDIHTVAAGGGSIARRDPGGRLRVGPESAGARPGPICYGMGGERITVTDANLFLGRIRPLTFLGGRMKLDTKAVARSMEQLGRSLGLSALETAEGIIKVANAVMERAIRVITVQKGHDPGDFTLVSFGGAGGLHAADLARSLKISRVLIPGNPGVFSAYGLVLADTVRDLSQTVLISAKSVNFLELNSMFEKLILSGAEEMETAGIGPETIRSQKSMDLRYRGQSFEITVPFSKGFRDSFHNAHEKLYGFSKRQELIEVVTLRVRLSSQNMARIKEQDGPAVDDTFTGAQERNPITDDFPRAIYRDHLKKDDIIEGPCIVTEANATTWIPEGFTGAVDGFGNLILQMVDIRS